MTHNYTGYTGSLAGWGGLRKLTIMEEDEEKAGTSYMVGEQEKENEEGGATHF